MTEQIKNEKEKEIAVDSIEKIVDSTEKIVDSKDFLLENERIITDYKFFGNNNPCVGKSYPVVFYKYNKDTSLYVGNLLDFSQEIYLRAGELPKKKGKFKISLKCLPCFAGRSEDN